MPRIPVRYLSLLAVLPLLLLSQAAEAARISFATKDCGTPPLLGLEFEVLTVETSGLNTVTATTTACPQEAVGSLTDPTGTTPLYGTSISSVEFEIFTDDPLTPITVDTTSMLSPELSFQATASGGILTAFFDSPIEILCGPSTSDSRLCFPPDLAIGLWEFPVGTTFRVTRVNDISVPEPGTLALLGLGLASAALRRRRATAKT